MGSFHPWRPRTRSAARAAGILLLGTLFGCPAAATVMGPPATPPAGAAAPVAPRPKVELTGSLRVRQEVWDWFGPGEEGRYTFTGALLRAGGTYSTPRHDLTLELAAPLLLNLPRDASLPPPQGQLGLGAAYRDANGSQEASVFLKQAFWRIKNVGGKGNMARLGRFEFIDGTETVPTDPSLVYLKRERIAHRLIGNFGWSHVGRSFDGGQFTHHTSDLNLTLFGGFPTQGVFDLDGMDTLSDVAVAYGAATRPFAAGSFNGDARLFGLYYHDSRDDVVKTDNRPAPVRAADQNEINVGTVGGHAVGVWKLGHGQLDGLLWGAAQFGDWGETAHRAYALDAEIGYQPEGWRWRPWFRAGFYHASGDGDPADGDHTTFFPVLPTPRVYARFPFYTLTNLNDAFLQVIARPNQKTTIRADAHFLSLADRNDLWYAGGGAFHKEPSFGYSGRPSGGQSDLASLLDASVDYQWRKDTTLALYLGYAFGGDVVRNIYGSRRGGFMGYVEAIRRF